MWSIQDLSNIRRQLVVLDKTDKKEWDWQQLEYQPTRVKKMSPTHDSLPVYLLDKILYDCLVFFFDIRRQTGQGKSAMGKIIYSVA